MSKDDQSEKSHDPTPKKREDFRKQGKFARARDAGAVLTIAATLGVIAGMRTSFVGVVQTLFTRTLGDPTALVRGDTTSLRKVVGEALILLVVPPLIAASIGACVAGFAQAGVSPNFDLVDFKLERLDPIPRLGQTFSPKHAMKEVFLALLKVGVVGYVAYVATMAELPALLVLAAVDGRSGGATVVAAIARMGLKIIGATAVVAGLDYAQSRLSLEKEMKMSLQEIKDEMKSEDGDPKVKGRMRARARQLAKKRMMSDVKTAALVVTNPTHVAVALRYDDSDAAPLVVAKGHDEVALAIRKEARSHGIPIIENRRLARLLDADVAIGKPIQVEHFTAVARVLAFVFKLHGRKKRAGKKVARKVR